MSRYIANLISQGEHQQLDFKHSISDSRKIARTLAAFANTDGGTLLIGVKDNGNVSGVNSDEEYYMLEGAAQMYCKPEVKFKVTRWDINNKVVLEVFVKSDRKNLYKAQDKNGKWKVYDVVVENVSLVQNYRNQFNEILASSTPEQLLQTLRDKVKKQ